MCSLGEYVNASALLMAGNSCKVPNAHAYMRRSLTLDVRFSPGNILLFSNTLCDNINDPTLTPNADNMPIHSCVLSLSLCVPVLTSLVFSCVHVVRHVFASAFAFVCVCVCDRRL